MAFDIFKLLRTYQHKAEQSILSSFAPCAIGIEGLPSEAADMQQGGLYVVTLPSHFDGAPLAIETAATALQQGSRVVLCSTQAQALAEPLSALVPSNSLHAGIALLDIDALAINHPALNLWDFLESLETQNAHRADCIIYLNAGSLLATHLRSANLRQLGILREWHRYHGCTGLFIAVDEAQTWPMLVRHSKQLAGLAGLADDDDRLLWRVTHWQTNNSRLGEARYGMGSRKDGRLFTLGLHQQPENNLRGGEDAHRVLSCWNPAKFGQSTPVNWEVFHDIDELVDEVMKTAIAATVILDHTQQQAFAVLARQVHKLRIACGRRLKIVIHEVDDSLSYQQEMQLYHTGATRLLRRDLDVSESFRVISSLKGQWFWRAIEPDFDKFFAQAQPNESVGYQKPIDFAITAEEFMRVSTNTHIDSVIVRLTLRSDCPHLNALNAFRPDRPGIFITNDNEFLYLFLFACPASDVDALMAKLFTMEVGSLFAFYEILVLANEISQTLEKIRYNAEFVGYTDYSDNLALTNSPNA
ncbi:MAG: BcsE family c-di-GMP-binding protein [Paraperlucidibaca sp.]